MVSDLYKNSKRLITHIRDSGQNPECGANDLRPNAVSFEDTYDRCLLGIRGFVYAGMTREKPDKTLTLDCGLGVHV